MSERVTKENVKKVINSLLASFPGIVLSDREGDTRKMPGRDEVKFVLRRRVMQRVPGDADEIFLSSACWNPYKLDQNLLLFEIQKKWKNVKCFGGWSGSTIELSVSN